MQVHKRQMSHNNVAIATPPHCDFRIFAPHFTCCQTRIPADPHFTICLATKLSDESYISKAIYVCILKIKQNYIGTATFWEILYKIHTSSIYLHYSFALSALLCYFPFCFFVVKRNFSKINSTGIIRTQGVCLNTTDLPQTLKTTSTKIDSCGFSEWSFSLKHVEMLKLLHSCAVKNMFFLANNNTILVSSSLCFSARC